jgi:hypothetical protein
MIVARQFTAWGYKKTGPSRRDGMIRSMLLCSVQNIESAWLLSRDPSGIFDLLGS